MKTTFKIFGLYMFLMSYQFNLVVGQVRECKITGVGSSRYTGVTRQYKFSSRVDKFLTFNNCSVTLTILALNKNANIGRIIAGNRTFPLLQDFSNSSALSGFAYDINSRTFRRFAIFHVPTISPRFRTFKKLTFEIDNVGASFSVDLSVAKLNGQVAYFCLAGRARINSTVNLPHAAILPSLSGVNEVLTNITWELQTNVARAVTSNVLNSLNTPVILIAPELNNMSQILSITTQRLTTALEAELTTLKSIKTTPNVSSKSENKTTPVTQDPYLIELNVPAQ